MHKHRFTLLLAALAALLPLTGCNDTSALLPSISGKAGEVIVVMEKPYWEDALGNDVRELLGHDCPWLAQKEPLYSLVNVVPSGFGDLFKAHRNLLLFVVGPQVDSAGIIYKHDMWAQPQCVIQVSAKTPEEASALLQEKGPMIVSSIEQAERDRVIRNTLRYEEISIYRRVSELFGGAPHFPTGYKIRKASEDFVWIADDKDGVYQDVLIYRYPVEDDPFQLDKIIAHRNEVMRDNVPGSLEGMYMTTSEFFPPTIEYIKFRGRDLVQTRGMWEVQNDFMGGPFVSHSFYSQDGSEIFVTEAFVYAPRFDKRQYLRQVESILYSWEWKENGEN